MGYLVTILANRTVYPVLRYLLVYVLMRLILAEKHLASFSGYTIWIYTAESDQLFETMAYQ